MSPALNTTHTSSAFLSKAGKTELVHQILMASLMQCHKDDLDSVVSLTVVDEVWKQQTLLQLLQIVELPMLDCILTSPARVQPQACRASLTNQDLVISNTCLERQLPDTLNLPQLVLLIITDKRLFAVWTQSDPDGMHLKRILNWSLL